MSCLEVAPLEQATRLRQSGITVGGAKSDSQLTQSASGTRASIIEAGGHVKLIAAGAGEDSHLTVRGSDVSAAGQATLLAEGNVTLQSQAQSVQQHRTERSRSAGVGLALTYGQGGWAAGFTANASAARGHADGQDLTHRHSEVKAGQGATLVSGRNTTLSGAQVSGEQITARVGGDLTVHSVQDTATYDSRHQSAGGSVTIGYGFAASASYSNARVEADHASVSQHSGLRAGDGGFDVKVQGHTELQGGLIASTQAAVDAGRNRLVTGSLSTQDLTNRSEHDARGISLSGGFSYGGSGKQGSSEGAGTGSPGTASPGTSAPAQPSSGVALQQFQTGSQGVAAGYVSDSSQRASTTRSGISGGELVITDEAAQQERTGQSIEETLASVNRNVLSGTEANGLTQRWDGQQLQQQVQAGAQIVATFGQQASKAVGDYAGEQRKALQEQARNAPTEAERQALLAEADKWDEGGAYRVAAHIAVGGLSGGLEGALGSGSSAAAVPHLAEAINAAGLPEPVRQAVIAAAGTAVGALTGGTTGAATGFNQTANNYLLHEEQLARSQADQACRSGDAQACQTRERLDQLSQTRQAELSHSCLDGSAAQCRANLSLLSQDYLALQASAQDLAARIAASTDPREVEALKALQKQNQTHLRQVAGLLKTNLGEIDQNKGGLTPAEKIVLASIHADTSGREITEALIGAAILGKKAADRLAGVSGGSSAERAPSADTAQIEQQKIENNVYRDGGIADPSQPMSATGPWTPAAAITPQDAHQMVQAALPAGVRVTGTESANEANQAARDRRLSPPHLPDTQITMIETTQPVQMVRVYTGDRQTGGWIMRAEDVQGLTPQQIASKYALPEVPTMITDVTIPPGTKLSVSVANPISPNAGTTGTRTGDNGGGGGVQFQIKTEFSDRNEFARMFSNPRPLSSNGK